jgi:hypothetical protein
VKELDLGTAKANAQVAGFLFNSARNGNVTAQIFWLKTRVGWKETPELNPVENVWQFLRDNWLSNRVFKSYEDLVDHCCEAWNKLVDQPWRIMTIGLRQWAHKF